MITRVLSTIAILLILVYIFRRYKEEKEDFIILKVIGYYLLGGFKFVFNSFPIPLGYGIYLLFLRPKVNKQLKRYAALLGLVAFFMGLLIPFIEESYFERTRYAKLSSDNVYEIDFLKDYKAIRKELDIKGSSKLEDFDIEFERDGKLKRMGFMIIARDNKGLVIYHVRVIPDKDRYSLRANRVDNWLQYNRLVDGEHFFSVLEDIDFKSIIPENNYPWYGINSRGEWVNGSKGHYLIEANEIKEIKDEEKVEGYDLWVFGMEKKSENSYGSTEETLFLFK